jgi:hypothetical protein
MEKLDLETRLPTNGDRLFIESDAFSESPLVTDPGERIYRLPLAYKRAADILVQQAAVDIIDNRNVIYPALYCYRHSIELHLKQLLNQFCSNPTMNNHDLKALWNRFVTVLNSHQIEYPNELKAAEELVLEMHDADVKSDGFRFPTNHSGGEFLFANRGVDLPNLMIVMQGLTNFFECCLLDYERREAKS